MLNLERGTVRPEGRKASGDVLHTSESTGDEQVSQMEDKAGLLEQQHRVLANHYMAKIKQMAKTIKQQSEIKEQLTKQIQSLAQQSRHQQTHISTLSAKLQQTQQEDRSRQHLNMVASAYLIPHPAVQTDKKGRNGRGTLFASEKWRNTRQIACKSETSHADEYLLYKSPETLRRRLKVENRQSQRVQI